MLKFSFLPFQKKETNARKMIVYGLKKHLTNK